MEAFICTDKKQTFATNLINSAGEQRNICFWVIEIIYTGTVLVVSEVIFFISPLGYSC